MDLDEWEERAAIMEFEAGLTRFRAETEAARRQGYQRWEIIDALDKRNIGPARDHGEANERNQPDDLSGLQRGAEEEDRPMSVGHGSGGQRGLVLPSLRVPGR
ncbi:hypothetical protein OEZ60_13095 [Defluviimonas sp. WL0024]|uniref:Uncharacterized protein n=1 Tax=Albidovulum salinarum TaxID=2984153 RepID=A0ABT2X4S5_9RHOB|nr:hypothetical protein [Defluviimonas sp. WL0024]MCU9848941.1 hypothetical protein [Defluviimonas sp. WL0024]